MTKQEREDKIRKLKTQVADKCVDIRVAAQDLRTAEEKESVSKILTRIKDSISEIERKWRQIDELEYTEVEKDRPVYSPMTGMTGKR